MTEDRLKKACLFMSACKIHTLIACHPKHVYYLSGFSTTARPYWQIGQTCCLISQNGLRALILPKPWGKEFSSVSGFQVVEYSGGAEGCAQTIAALLPGQSDVKVGADLTWMNTPLFRALSKEVPHISLLDEHPVLAWCRMDKDLSEIQALYQACKISDHALQKAGLLIREGSIEQEIQTALDSQMIQEGSLGGGFTTKVISGSNGSFPHHVAGNHQISAKSATIVDLSASVNHYESDSARTYLTESPAQKECSELSCIHQGICEILAQLPKKLRPGVPVSDIDRFVRKELSRLRPDALQAGTIGHGVGLHAHEYPDITPDSSELLQENMVLAIEPALYLPGHWGIRIENMFHIHCSATDIMNELEASYGHL